MGFEQLLVFEGVVVLSKRHRARVVPAVDNLGYTVHLAAALVTLEGHGIYEGAVKLNIRGAVGRESAKLFYRADGMDVSA